MLTCSLTFAVLQIVTVPFVKTWKIGYGPAAFGLSFLNFVYSKSKTKSPTE